MRPIGLIIIKNTPLFKKAPLLCPGFVNRGGFLIKSAEGREIFCDLLYVFCWKHSSETMFLVRKTEFQGVVFKKFRLRRFIWLENTIKHH